MVSGLLIAGAFLLVGVSATADSGASIPIATAGPGAVAVGPGSVVCNGRTVAIAAPVTLPIAPSPIEHIANEQHPTVRVFDPNTGGWRKGERLQRLITQECSATGLLYPESVRIKPAPDSPDAYVRGTDFEMDEFWGTFGRLDGGAIAADQAVFVDYDYSPCRLDTIAVGTDGGVRLVAGTPGVGVLLPPELGDGEVAVANIWVPGRTESLTEENLYPIEFGAPAAPPADTGTAETLLPKTLAKLRAGEEVTIVAWGDSVTNGGGVDRAEHWYQERFAALLRERFPQATVTMLTASWPGGNSRMYLDAPPEDERNFARDVLEPRPDLVTIEFVNDAGLSEEATQIHYAGILERLQGIEAEAILITPHFVRPDWMRVSTMKLDADPRPYVHGLRRFAAENHVALADASAQWCRLWRQGIPYITLEGNSINHPDVRGHEIFAQCLIGLFPKE
ncbi:MAG: SGNH/GDSL hydrolase family protein [Candidatus Hydrogenedentes bacterium]|nr:SGNH/GDSL hydrolase family protein [Candidatus Hydrogenedentota bacterium]